MYKNGKYGVTPIFIIFIIVVLVANALYFARKMGNWPSHNNVREKLNEPIAKEPIPVLQSPPQSAPTPQEAQSNYQTEYSQSKCASNIAPKFTHTFTDLSTIDALNPIGGIGGGSPARSYIAVKTGTESPIYAPRDAIVRAIIYVDRGSSVGEYGVFLNVSCEVEILFDHIDRLSNRLLPYAPKTVSYSTRTEDGTEPYVSIKAGELIGYSNGTDLARTWDFLVMNYGKKNAFLNPKRWQWDQAIYGSCPYDYFIEELRLKYYGVLGKPSNTGLISATKCGSPSYDVAGTASGGWFKGESTDSRGEFLAIAHEYNEVMIAYRKDGMAFATNKDAQTGKPYFNITDSSPRKYPTGITVGDSICYSDNNAWAYIRLNKTTELSVAMGEGQCPAIFPESQAETWIR